MRLLLAASAVLAFSLPAVAQPVIISPEQVG